MTPKLRLRRRLELHQLEPRETPAVSVTSSGSTLKIIGDGANSLVNVAQKTAESFEVTVVEGLSSSSYTVNKVYSISISMGAGNDTVSLDFNGGLKDKLTVDMGDGNDSFTTSASVGGTIGGKTTVSTGPSTHTTDGTYDDVIELYNLTFKGPVDASGFAGDAADQLDIQNAIFNGPVSATNFYIVDLGFPNDASLAAIFKSNLSIDNSKLDTDSRLDQDDGPGNGVFGYAGLTIDGNFTYLGGSGRDDVNLPADPGAELDTSPSVHIDGNVTVKGGEGTNTLSLGNGDNGAAVDGHVDFTGGEGIDRFFFDSGSVVEKNVTLKLDGGNNQVFGDSTGMGGGPFNPTGTATVGGHLTVTLGDDANFIGTYGAGAKLTVGKKLSITVGDGDNLGGDASSPGAITLFNTNLSVGDEASFKAGTGSQDINIQNGDLPKLKITLGGGDNSVRFTLAGEILNGDATIDFGKGDGVKFFDPPTVVNGKLVVKNYP